jgi:hypothetical protein
MSAPPRYNPFDVSFEDSFNNLGPLPMGDSDKSLFNPLFGEIG